MYKKTNLAAGTLSAQLLVGGSSLVLQTDEGLKFPDTGSGNTFVGVIWGAAYLSPEKDATTEFVVAYRSSGDTFSITRAQEGTSAKQWEIGDNFMLTASKAVFDEYETALGDKADKTNVLELDNTDAFTPDADYEPATKKYVDDNIPAIPVKATAAENVAGTDDSKFLTALSNVPAFYSSMSRQAIMNGNFDVWQRGTSVNIPDGVATFQADRWRDFVNKDGGTLPTLTRSRQLLISGDIPNAYYFTRLVTDGAGTSLGVNSQGRISQKIENGVRNLCGVGKKVTVSFWARSDIANKRICSFLFQNYGTGGSPSTTEGIQGTPITLTSTWTKYTATFTTNTLVGKTFGTNADDLLELSIGYMWGTTFGNTYVQTGVSAETFVGAGNIDIAQVQLCAGDVALPFQPKSYEEELRACQRYFETGSYRIRLVDNNSQIAVIVSFKVTKRVPITNTGGTITGTGVVIDSSSTFDNCFIVATPATNGIIDRVGDWTASAEL